MRISVKALERFCAFFLIFWFLGAWVSIFVRPDDLGDFGKAAEASPILRLIWIPIYLLILGLVTIRLRYFLPVLAINWPPLVLVLIAFTSVIWSVSPDDTLRRTIALAMTTICGFYFGMRYTQSELLRLLAWALGIIMVISWLVSIGMPDIGVMKGTLAGAWRGPYAHKNQLGSNMQMAVVVFALLAYQEKPYRRLRVMFALGCLALVVLSSSQTALLICILLTALFVLSKVMSLPARQAIPLTAVVIASGLGAAILGGFLVEQILTSMGRDMTLTGRSEIWAGILVSASERPWLGFGYEAFWVTTVQEERAHNGFLDVLLGFGGIGLLVLLFSYGRSIRDGVRLLRIPGREEAHWMLLFLGMYFLHNLTEAVFLKQNELLWILYCAISTRAAVDLRAYALQSTNRYMGVEIGGRRSVSPEE